MVWMHLDMAAMHMGHAQVMFKKFLTSSIIFIQFWHDNFKLPFGPFYSFSALLFSSLCSKPQQALICPSSHLQFVLLAKLILSSLPHHSSLFIKPAAPSLFFMLQAFSNFIVMLSKCFYLTQLLFIFILFCLGVISTFFLQP